MKLCKDCKFFQLPQWEIPSQGEIARHSRCTRNPEHNLVTGRVESVKYCEFKRGKNLSWFSTECGQKGKYWVQA